MGKFWESAKLFRCQLRPTLHVIGWQTTLALQTRCLQGQG